LHQELKIQLEIVARVALWVQNPSGQ
jgi:hypothetical protein